MKKTTRICALALSLIMVLGVLPFGLDVEAEAATLSFDTDGLTREAAEAYRNICEGLVGNYGGFASSDEVSYNEDGLGFAGGLLRDLNGDGMPELVTVCTQYDYNDFAYLDIWTFRDREEHIFSDSFFLNSSNGGFSVVIFENNDRCFLEISYSDGGFGDTIVQETIYTFSGTSVNEQLAFSHSERYGNDDGIDVFYSNFEMSKNGGAYVGCSENDYYSARREYFDGSDFPLLSFSEYGGFMALGFTPNGEALINTLANCFPEATSPAPAVPAATAASPKSYIGGIIPYYGDESKLNLTPEIAEAYAQLIRDEYAKGMYNVRVVMFDGGGVPMMWLASGNGGDGTYIAYDYMDHVYTYRNGKVEQCKWISTLLKAGENGVVVRERVNMASDFVSDLEFYRINGGQFADSYFADGTYGPWDVIYNGTNYGDSSNISWSEYYRLADSGASVLAAAVSGLSDQLNLYGEWSDGEAALTVFDSFNVHNMDSKMREAYRKYAQQLVNQYGMYNCEINHFDYPGDYGVVGASCADMTGDGLEELYIAIVYPEDDTTAKILMYDYATGRKTTIEEFYNSWVGITMFSLCRDSKGKAFANHAEGKHFVDPYIWDGSKFVTTEITEAQRNKMYNEEPVGGLAQEGAMRFDFLCDNLGIDHENYSTYFTVQAGMCYLSCSDQTATLTALGVNIPADPAKLLASVPYIGDRSKCRLSAAQAMGYAEAIESLRGTEYEADYALLIDFAGNGMPILLTSNYGYDSSRFYGVTIWHIVNGAVERYDFSNAVPLPGEIYTATYNEDGVFILGTFLMGGHDADYGEAIFASRNGELVLIRSFCNKAVPSIYGPPDFAKYMDGVAVDNETYNAEHSKLSYNKLIMNVFGGVFGGVADYDQEFYTSANDTVKALRAYAASYSGYSFPKAEDVDEASLVEAIAKAVAEAVGGEISGIYKLADGVYYVLITVDGSARGCLVTGSREKGKTVWNVGDVDSEPLSEEELKAILAEMQSKSNLELDFSAIGSKGGTEAMDSLRTQLDNMPGLVPTDPAKGEIADYIQSAISAGATITLPGSDNRFTPDPEAVDAIRAEAEKAKGEYEKLLGEYGIELNRPITIIIRIVWTGMDSGKACQIELNEELLAAMSDCEVQLLLGDTRHYVRVSTETLEILTQLYGCVKIQMAVDADGIYTIHFLDEAEERIERLEAPIGFGLPAETPLATVVVNYDGGSLNWGGQYDPNAKVISFDAGYSGRYEIFENAVDISDISELDDETRAAIAFLVSKGYMSAENGLFDPDGQLSRYQFAQALVGMFFALDPSLETGFEDVPADSPFYSYVASGESLDIIKGYDDTRFGGDDGLTTEQMLSLAARTLVNYKHYAQPGDPESYLSSFTDGAEVSEWARSEVALAVREGLIDRGGEMGPEDSVSRSEAAKILYRLFLLLHEVPAVELELPEVSVTDEENEPAKGESDEAEGSAAGTVIAIVIVLLAAGGGAGWWFLKKKKSPAENESDED